MMSTSTFDSADYARQAQQEEERRERINRALRLLRRLKDAADAGDPIPGLPEILALTGLAHPGVEAPQAALAALLAQAEAERAAVNRRLRLARELRGVVESPLTPTPAPPVAPPVAPPTVLPQGVGSVPPSGGLQDEASRLARISPRELDGLPYGCIVMDESGRVVAYNDTESRMARLPVEAVLGRNFFTEVAPCTRVKDFEGRFRDLAGGRTPAVVQFEFTFPFPFGAQRVSVLLTRGATPGTVLMALLRR